MPLTPDERDEFLEEFKKLFQLLEHASYRHNRINENENNSSVKYKSALDTAERIYSQRRVRAKHFADSRLFGEPAWDMLLDLYIRGSQGEAVSIKSASIGSMSPETTALRWLRVLEGDGLVQSTPDNSDLRRRLVKLTQKGHETLTRFLREVEQDGRQVRP